jgi:hypothetical protein
MRSSRAVEGRRLRHRSHRESAPQPASAGVRRRFICFVGHSRRGSRMACGGTRIRIVDRCGTFYLSRYWFARKDDAIAARRLTKSISGAPASARLGLMSQDPALLAQPAKFFLLLGTQAVNADGPGNPVVDGRLCRLVLACQLCGRSPGTDQRHDLLAELRTEMRCPRNGVNSKPAAAAPGHARSAARPFRAQWCSRRAGGTAGPTTSLPSPVFCLRTLSRRGTNGPRFTGSEYHNVF